jgi:hypothetical protein
VVQQRGGVQLKGGVGEVGDPHERHADQVADAVVQGRSVEGLLDRYAGASGDGAARATAVQRQEHPTGVAQPVIASAAATSAAAPPATAPATVHEPVDTTITDTTRVQSVEILHAEEIFADLPANTTTKKHAFNRLNHAMQTEKKAEKTAATAKTPKANAALAAARGLGLIHSRGQVGYVAITSSPGACDGAPVGFPGDGISGPCIERTENIKRTCARDGS